MAIIKNIGIDAFRLNDYGIGTYIKNTIKHLKGSDENFRYFTFCNPSDVDMLEQLNPDIVPVMRKKFQYSTKDLLTLSLEMKKLNINLYHSTHYISPLIHRLPLVITIHDMLPFEFPDSFEPTLLKGMKNKKIVKAIERADKIISVSRSTKSDILKYVPIDPEKITVIHNGVDDQFFDKVSSKKVRDFRERYQLNFPFILYAGNVRIHKNIERLIECMAELSEPPYDQYRLVIAGYDIAKNKGLRRLIGKKGLKERVRFLGYTHKVIFLYKMAKVFVNPSLYEGFGVSVLESMAVGTPVVASNKSALPEVAADAAMFVDPYNTIEMADAIKKIIDKPRFKNKLVRAGKERAAQFRWEESVKKLVEVYHEILK